MRITVTLPLTFEVEFDTEDAILDINALEEDTIYAILDTIHDQERMEEMVDRVTEHTGWCINSWSMNTPKLIN
jgi:hypothetical protein